ncbi:LacI family DNA-binding transcriptional regulator [uncultured Microbacterium sp.]|uniref:LacI family DNA-binding transcriptional regulator n=1 Tax=uncultured Microbacterium sp. TaxID=191216 RepID=UPI0028E1FDC8|nr:LacI family DNA-binding transcriptional regulator [uncultured Microbacterium sp.]
MTAADIARSLGVSRATVGFVLNETPGQTISAATTERVLAEARRLGYRPHIAARALASGRSHIVLLVLPDWPIEYSLRENIDEATHALDEHGYTLITYTPHEGSRARPLWETMQPDVVLGLLPFSDPLVKSMRNAGVERIVPDPDEVSEVRYNEGGPRLQVEHLHDLGHRRLGFARPSDPRLFELADAREEAAAAAAIALGLEVPVTLATAPASAEADPSVSEWIATGITGVVAFNDDVATAIIGAASRAGIAVPWQLSVIGHDDTPMSLMVEPRISSVRIDSTGLGHYLAALAIHAMDQTPTPDWEQTSAVTLIPRASTSERPTPHG